MRQERNVITSLLLEKKKGGFFDCTNPIHFLNGLNWFTRSGKHVESPVHMYIEAKSIPIALRIPLGRKTQVQPVQLFVLSATFMLDVFSA